MKGDVIGVGGAMEPVRVESHRPYLTLDVALGVRNLSEGTD